MKREFKKMLKGKRILSLFLSGVLIAGTCPTFAFASEGTVPGLDSPMVRQQALKNGKVSFEDLVKDENLGEKITNISKEIDAKKENLKNVDDMVGDGIYGLLVWAQEKYPKYHTDISNSYKILDKFIEAGDVHLSKKTDAGSYENLLRTADYLEKQNYLRVHDEHFKCEKQDTNFEILCKAIVSANRSTDPSLGHRHTFDYVAENLAWGYNPDSDNPERNDPFCAWYTEEKVMWEFQEDYIKKYMEEHSSASRKEAEAKATEARKALIGTVYKGKKIRDVQIGHYENIVRNDCGVAAIAINSDKTANEYGVTYAMNAGYTSQYQARITQEEYREIIEKYKRATNKAEINKDINKLEADLALAQKAKVEQDAQKAADLALTELEAKKGNVTDAEIQTAQDKINNIQIATKKQELNNRLATVRADKDIQDVAEKAVKALEDKNGNVTNTEIEDAQTKVDKVKDSTAKQSLTSRLDNVRQAKVDLEAKEKEAIDEATELVKKAEEAQTEEAYAEAKKKVDALTSKGAKTELEARLAAVDKLIEADKALSALEGKNISDVTAKELTDAEKLVNDVKDEWKEELTNRLNKLKNNKAEDDKKKEEEAKKLAGAKEEATKKINALENLSPTEKTNHTSKVNAANKVEDVNKALLDAQKDNAKNVIASLNKLKEDEVAKAKGDIDKAENAPAINQIVKEAQAKQTARQSLDEHKDQAKTKIDPLSKLSDAEKNAYKNKISEAATKDAVDVIVLEAQKDNGKKEIAAMNLLKPEEATKANEDIQNAQDADTIKNIVDKAQEKQDKRQVLEGDKNQAKAKVDTLDKLNQEEKEAYKARIGSAESKEAADAIVLEAQKDNGKKVIAGLDKLTDEERTQADQEIASAGTEDVINSTVKAAQDKQKDRQDLEAYKTQANTTIDGLDKLEAGEKEAYKGRVNEAKAKSAVDPIVLEAQKANAKKKVEDLTKLNEEEKAEALKAIDEAQDQDQIESAIKNAQASNVSLEEIKAQSIEKLKTLGKLSSEEKASFEKKINEAETKAAARGAILEAEKENTKREEAGRNQGSRDNRPLNIWGQSSIYPPLLMKKNEIQPKPENKKIVVKLQSRLRIGYKGLTLGVGGSVKGAEREVMMDVEPYVENNRTMLPVRFVAEGLGFKVDWDQATRTVILTDKDNVVKIPIDTNKIIVNGKVYESDVKPSVKRNRTVLPIANIARALGLKDGTDIIWDQKTKEVVITREIVR